VPAPIQVSNTAPHSINGIKTVFIIMMENHDWSTILGSSYCTYINDTLLPMSSYCSDYNNPPGNHPSEPNYLWLVAGTAFGIQNDNPPSLNHLSSTNNLFTQLDHAGISWKTYQEDITGNNIPNVNNGRYGSGREGVKTYYDNALRGFHCSMHLVANHVIDFDDDDHAHGVVYCHAQHHVLEPEHWWDEVLAYWDTYERLDGAWCFRRRRVRSWYRQEHGDRVIAPAADQGPKRGVMMPEAFPTFEAFWARPPLAEAE
jgi:hypothetical protein